jgi:hypothetical protein
VEAKSPDARKERWRDRFDSGQTTNEAPTIVSILPISIAEEAWSLSAS